MRKVFLIRHGHPDFSPGTHMCLGRTDTPLGAIGRMQAVLLGEQLKEERLTVFTSPLTRCCETALPLERVPQIVQELQEQDMGPWDGLDFEEIKQRWPELYERRAYEPLLVPSGAESLMQVRERVLPAMKNILAFSEGDTAIIAHASVIQVILAEALGTALEESRSLRIPYGSYAILNYDGRFSFLHDAVRSSPALSPALAEKLLSAAAPGERVEAHCMAVKDEALRIADALPLSADKNLLASVSLLHDIARAEKDHAATGAAWLRELGYTEAADIVAQHHDLRYTSINEAAILYIADKCMKEERRVTIAERFAASEDRCRTPEAKAAWKARLDNTLRLKEAINSICGKTVIE